MPVIRGFFDMYTVSMVFLLRVPGDAVLNGKNNKSTSVAFQQLMWTYFDV